MNFPDFQQNSKFPWLILKFPDFFPNLEYPWFSLTSGNPASRDYPVWCSIHSYRHQQVNEASLKSHSTRQLVWIQAISSALFFFFHVANVLSQKESPKAKPAILLSYSSRIYREEMLLHKNPRSLTGCSQPG